MASFDKFVSRNKIGTVKRTEKALEHKKLKPYGTEYRTLKPYTKKLKPYPKRPKPDNPNSRVKKRWI
jgi:hypothetical protein